MSWAVSLTACTTVTVVLAVGTKEFAHWFLIPTTIAGVLIAVDAVDWFRGRLDLFDPIGLMGLYGVYFFFLTPLMHVWLDSWPRYLTPPSDWYGALGALSLVNVVGLLIYRVLLLAMRSTEVPLRAERPNMAAVAMLGVAVSGTALVVLVLALGGPAQYLMILTSDQQSLSGLGWLVLVGESLPMFAFGWVVIRKKAELRRHTWLLVIVLAAFVVLTFLLTGIRGSRGNTVWPLLVMIGTVHVLVRPITRGALAFVAAVLVAFMFLYGIYKSEGVDLFVRLAQGESVEELSQDTGRDLPTLLLGDFGRAGVQAIVLDRAMAGDPPLAWGLTYVGDVASFIPQVILPVRPPDKATLASELLYGQGAGGTWRRPSNIYGVSGEAALNFGVAAAPLAMVPVALLVVYSRRRYLTATQNQNVALGLVAPALSVMCVVFLFNDLDNTLYFFLKSVAPLAIVAGAGSRRVRAGRLARRASAGTLESRGTPGSVAGAPSEGGEGR